MFIRLKNGAIYHVDFIKFLDTQVHVKGPQGLDTFINIKDIHDVQVNHPNA